MQLGWVGDGASMGRLVGRRYLVPVPSDSESAEPSGRTMRGRTEFNNLESLCIKQG